MHAEKFPMLTDVSTPTFPRTNNNHSSVRSRRGARSGYLVPPRIYQSRARSALPLGTED